MVGLGAILLLVGFAMVVPWGGFSGPAARRHHGMGLQGIQTTPDDRHRGPDRKGLYRVLAGIVLCAAGVVCIAVSG